jgi:hypothetical protein
MKDGGEVKKSRSAKAFQIHPQGRIKGPGTGTSDSIKAYLSNGEYVLPKAAVDMVGVEKLDRLKNVANDISDAYTPRMNEGGPVQATFREKEWAEAQRLFAERQAAEQFEKANRKQAINQFVEPFVRPFMAAGQAYEREGGGLRGVGAGMSSFFSTPGATHEAAINTIGALDEFGQGVQAGRGPATSTPAPATTTPATTTPAAPNPAAQFQQEGFTPLQQTFVAGDGSQPANIFYRDLDERHPTGSGGGVTTEYQIPGVTQAGGGGRGAAVFQGQRKGGGSFSVVGGRSKEEQQAIDETVAGINRQIDAMRRLNGKPTQAEEAQMQRIQKLVDQYLPPDSEHASNPQYQKLRADMAMNALQAEGEAGKLQEQRAANRFTQDKEVAKYVQDIREKNRQWGKDVADDAAQAFKDYADSRKGKDGMSFMPKIGDLEGMKGELLQNDSFWSSFPEHAQRIRNGTLTRQDWELLDSAYQAKKSGEPAWYQIWKDDMSTDQVVQRMGGAR